MFWKEVFQELLKLRFSAKLETIHSALETNHDEINAIYGSGAVEGYSDEYLSGKTVNCFESMRLNKAITSATLFYLGYEARKVPVGALQKGHEIVRISPCFLSLIVGNGLYSKVSERNTLDLS